MINAMIFPDTFEEFVKIFGFVDSKKYYTNGSELIQVFRVEQWLEHELNRLEKENANYSRNNRSLTASVTEMQKALKKQSAEIERLKNEVFAKEDEYNDMVEQRNRVESHLETAKAEATEQLSKKIESRLANNTDISNAQYQSIIFDISEACKEMVGDAE